jgi:hypothetical protein
MMMMIMMISSVVQSETSPTTEGTAHFLQNPNGTLLCPEPD